MTFTLSGQLQSGKNRVLITRTGHRYPPKRFQVWRDAMVKQIRQQCDGFPQPITHEVKLIVDYTPGDQRTRDIAGMLDALGHLLERSGLLESDGLIRGCTWEEFPMDRQRPQSVVTLVRK